MEIKVAKTAGFCFGVKRAVETVYKQVEKQEGTPIYTYGPIIHNDEGIKDMNSIPGVMFIVDPKNPIIQLKPTSYNANELAKEINSTPEEIMHKPSWFFVDGKWNYFKGMENLERFITDVLECHFCND